MIDQNAPLHELPEYWQAKVRQYRSENHSLRGRLRDTERLAAQDLPPSWAKKLRKLRDEAVQVRRERNEARAALAEEKLYVHQLGGHTFGHDKGCSACLADPAVQSAIKEEALEGSSYDV